MEPYTAAERSQALLLACLAQLESFMQLAREQSVSPEDIPLWDELFGAKESVIGVLHKLVSMQKAILDLRARESEQEAPEDTAPMRDEDWELIALCVERWREEKLHQKKAETARIWLELLPNEE